MSKEREGKSRKDFAQRINDAYEQYAIAKNRGPAEHARAWRDALESIPLLYIEYLDAMHCPKTLENSILKYSIGEAWEACFANDNMMAGLLESYDPDKGSFFVYLDWSAQRRIGSAAKRSEILDRRLGMKPFTREEERTLGRLLRYAGDNAKDLDFWGEDEYRSFCRNAGIDEAAWLEVSKLYETNQNIYAIRSSQTDEDEGGSDFIEDGWGWSQTDARPVEDAVFSAPEDDRRQFHPILAVLDEKLYPQLSVGKQRMWPDLFTRDYTDMHIHACKERIGKSEGAVPTIAELFRRHFGYMDFPAIREEYGNGKYLFMRDWIFGYIIEQKTPLRLSDLAEKYYQCSLANLSKEKSKMQDSIKKILN